MAIETANMAPVMAFENGCPRALVIGSGRFGSCLYQGVKGAQVPGGGIVEVEHMSARKFCEMSSKELVEKFSTINYAMYCGYNLIGQVDKLAQVIMEASPDGALEFFDFTNPEPDCRDENDIGAAMRLKSLLDNNCPFKYAVWKVTEVDQYNVSNTEKPTYASVYGGYGSPTDGFCKAPRLILPNLDWNTPTFMNLEREIRDRTFQKCRVQMWVDANNCALICLLLTFVYAFSRYSELVNGKYYMSMMPMYVLDKAMAWTALWMMVVSPFAGNCLKIGTWFNQWSKVSIVSKAGLLVSSIGMSFAFIEFLPVLALLLPVKVVHAYGRGYWSQVNSVSQAFKILLVDLVTEKGETGCVGVVWAIIHSFLGCIICTPAYKTKWWNEDDRLKGEMEWSMMTGAVSTGLLLVVGYRSILGKASWILLKPIYKYASPLGVVFATIHVVAFGLPGWYKLFQGKYHNGQMSITFMSSMYPIGILGVWFFMKFFKVPQTDEILRNSYIQMAENKCDAIMLSSLARGKR